MSETQLVAGTPAVTPETEEFWSGAARGELRLQWCLDCDRPIWYPRAICPVCHGTDTQWRTSAGLGMVYSYSVVRRAVGRYAESTPFVLAYVELDEGPRMRTNIVDCAADSVRIGQRVRAVFHPVEETDGVAVVRFTPVPDDDAPPSEET